MYKRLLAMLFICTLFVLCCSYAMALEGKNGPYSYSVKKNGDLCITAFDWKAYGNKDVYIPKMIDGYTVTEIGEAAFSDYHISDGILFNGSNSAVAVVIPNTITQIGEKAFFGAGITTMNIPSSVKVIGYGAFASCKNLTDFSVDKDNERYTTIEGVLYDKTKRELLSYPSGNKKRITIPEGIKSIADYAFCNAKTRKITLPLTIEKIGAHAFEYSAFEEITYEGNTEHLSYEIVLPPSIQSIGEYSFANAMISYSNQAQVSLEKTNLISIPSHAFYNPQNGELAVDFPSSLERIEEYAFAGTESSEGYWGDLFIPKSLKYIGEYSFYNSSVKIQFEEGSALEEIGNYAFYEGHISVKKDENLILPDSLVKIGINAFFTKDQHNFIDILTIPASVQEIGDNICDRLKIKIQVEDGSYAEFWATQNGYNIIHAEGDDTSWLND